MRYSVAMFFPLIAEFGGQPKQVIYTHEVEADTVEGALLKTLELEVVDCGDGMYARPGNASIYCVTVKLPDKGNGEDNLREGEEG